MFGSDCFIKRLQVMQIAEINWSIGGVIRVNVALAHVLDVLSIVRLSISLFILSINAING